MRYRIGSFNLKNFGAYANFETADAPRRDFEKIAQIIREESLDVVAFQEILSEGKDLRRLLEQYINMPYHPWDFCWASPRESSDPAKCVDLNADAPYVGVDTLQLIMPDTATQTFVNPDMM